MKMTFSYGPAESQLGDLHLPDAARPAVICLLHGGFWRMPYGRDEMSAVAEDLAGCGFAVWNIEYRRVGEPGGGWPGTLADVASAIDYLAALSAGVVPLDLERVAVVGHSAGGHLALYAAHRARASDTRFAPDAVRPAAVAGLAAVTDPERAFELDSGGGAVRELLGGTPDEYPDRYLEASPLRQLPLRVPQLILHGADDTALPAGMARRYADAALRAGDPVKHVELAGTGHMEFLDPRSEAHRTLKAWLLETLGAESSANRDANRAES